MLLAIDIGNTHTVIGVYEAERLRGHWRLSSVLSRTADECGALIRQMIQTVDIEYDEVTGVVLASVVPPLTSICEEMVERYIGCRFLVVSAENAVGITVGSAEPKRVGADRIANAVGAFEKFGGPTIVVDLGTATTFDVITADGVYLGGVIAPGLETSAAHLFHKAAQLPRIDVTRPVRVIGSTTEECLRAGLFYSTVGSIDEIVRRIEKELGAKTTVVATGGFAPLVSEETETIEAVEPFLTLDGLRLLFDNISQTVSGNPQSSRSV